MFMWDIGLQFFCDAFDFRIEVMQHYKMNWEMFPLVLFSDLVCVALMFPSLMLDRLGHGTHLGLEFSWSGFLLGIQFL